jgi:hypothetical protein
MSDSNSSTNYTYDDLINLSKSLIVQTDRLNKQLDKIQKMNKLMIDACSKVKSSLTRSDEIKGLK